MIFQFAGFFLNGTVTGGDRDDPPAKIVNKSGSRSFQVVGGPGWERQQAYDRGNQWINLSFECCRRFATVAEAEAYVLGYENAGHHPWVGTVRVLLGANQMVMHGATIQPPSLSNTGCLVHASYTLEGPGFEPVAVAVSNAWYAAGDSLIPSGLTTFTAEEAFEVSGSSMIPSASFTLDSHWETSSTTLRPTGA
jgi:hypothetical protein